MKIRKSEVFDCKHSDLQIPGRSWDEISRTDDGRTFYIVGGAKGGCRRLYHFEVSHGEIVRVGVALHPFARTLVHCDRWEAEKVLQRAADQASHGRLVPLEELGFSSNENEEPFYHPDGWFTRGEFAIPELKPEWLNKEEVKDVHLFKEGVFVRFVDETYRLISDKKLFFNLPICSPPIQRQGDFLIYGVPPERVEWPKEGEGYVQALDRHRISPGRPNIFVGEGDVRLQGVHLLAGDHIVHPEHEELMVECESFGFLLPGSSRPFRRERGGAD